MRGAGNRGDDVGWQRFVVDGTGSVDEEEAGDFVALSEEVTGGFEGNDTAV
jgi:hypothetical protein